MTVIGVSREPWIEAAKNILIQEINKLIEEKIEVDVKSVFAEVFKPNMWDVISEADVQVELLGFSNKYELDYKQIMKDIEAKFLEFRNQEPETEVVAPLNLLMPNKEMIAEELYKRQPFFYDKIGLFWIWNTKKLSYERIDEFELMNNLKTMAKEQNAQVTQNQFWTETIRALKLIGRSKEPLPFKKTWIQFGKTIYDYKNGDKLAAVPDFFNVNPLPFEVGKEKDTPELDKLLIEWVGEEKVKTMKQIIALCCIQDYPLHRFVILFGKGLNGKGRFLEFMTRFVGENNLCCSDLERLTTNRFETSKLYKKLICQISETNFAILKDTALLKQITGQDMIGAEFKNKDSFDFHNYAFVVIASNSIPPTTDKTCGFYRRPLIIDFKSQFKEGQDPLERIPYIEYNNLCNQILELLPKLLESGKFDDGDDIKTREARYEERSNPLMSYIKEKYDKDVNGEVPFWQFYDDFVVFCKDRGFRKQTKQSVSKLLKIEGYDTRNKDIKIDNQWKQWKHIFGIKSRVSYSSYSSYSTSTIPPPQGTESTMSKKSKKSTKLSKMCTLDDVLSILKEETVSIEWLRNELKKDYNVALFDEFITNLISKGILFEPRSGFIKKV